MPTSSACGTIPSDLNKTQRLVGLLAADKCVIQVVFVYSEQRIGPSIQCVLRTHCIDGMAMCKASNLQEEQPASMPHLDKFYQRHYTAS